LRWSRRPASPGNGRFDELLTTSQRNNPDRVSGYSTTGERSDAAAALALPTGVGLAVTPLFRVRPDPPLSRLHSARASRYASQSLALCRGSFTIKRAHLDAHGHRHALASGMQVAAEIQLGTRSVLEYLLSPVQKAFHEAGRER
jgi:hypothetical protein